MVLLTQFEMLLCREVKLAKRFTVFLNLYRL